MRKACGTLYNVDGAFTFTARLTAVREELDVCSLQSPFFDWVDHSSDGPSPPQQPVQSQPYWDSSISHLLPCATQSEEEVCPVQRQETG